MTDQTESAAPSPARVSFDADEMDLRAVVLRQGAVNAFSFGLYRFWYRTALRRLFWGRTAVGPDRFEYVGTAGELLVGALIALIFLSGVLLLVNFSLAFYGLALWQGRITALNAFASFVALLPLIEFARFRARRYRLLRTRWRGVRFAMRGFGLGFVWLWARWFLLAVLTLGLAWPWLRVARERYMTERMVYGDAPFRFSGTARPLFSDWLTVWLTGVVALAGLSMLGGMLRRFRVMLDAGGVVINLTQLLYLIGLACIAYFLIRAYCGYRAAEQRLILSARSVCDVRVRCEATQAGYMRAVHAAIGRLLGLGALVAVFLVSLASVALRLAVWIDGGDPGSIALSLDPAMLARFSTVGGQAAFIGAIWVNYALTVLFFSWLRTAVLRRRIHAHICATTVVSGLESLATVRQREEAGQLESEGFADALDFGGL